MALYIVSNEIDYLLVRARNGERAKEIAGMPAAIATRITEQGDEGILTFDMPDSATDHEPPPSDDHEIDITSLSDGPGRRRYKNLTTGKERTEEI